MKGIVLLTMSFAFIAAGIFLIRRARAMSRSPDRQLNSLPYDFTDRTKMFGFGIAMIVFACLAFHGACGAGFGP